MKIKRKGVSEVTGRHLTCPDIQGITIDCHVPVSYAGTHIEVVLVVRFPDVFEREFPYLTTVIRIISTDFMDTKMSVLWGTYEICVPFSMILTKSINVYFLYRFFPVISARIFISSNFDVNLFAA